MAEDIGESDRALPSTAGCCSSSSIASSVARIRLGVIRDPANNSPRTELPIKRHLGYTFDGVAATTSYAFPEREVVLR